MTAADKIAEAPKRIWLDSDSFNGAVGFAHPKAHAKAHWPAYIRADLADALAQENAKLKAIIAAMDGAAPLADKTCDEPGITLSEAVQREWPNLRLSPTPSPEAGK